MEPLRLLLVDDDAVDRMAVRRALRAVELGAEIVEAENAASALALLEEDAFDCLLLDLRLPDRDGLDLLRSLRAGGNPIPTVMLTGHGDEQTAVSLMQAGASDYIAKGALTPDRLHHSILQAVELGRAREQARLAHAARDRHVAQLRQLAAAAASIHASLSVEDVLRTTAVAAREIVGCTVVVARVATVDGIRATHAIVADELPPGMNAVGETPAEPPVIPETIRCSAPELASSPERLELAEQAGFGLPVDEWLCAPLTARDGSFLGLLHLAGGGCGLGSADEAIAIQLARLAAGAIENARLLALAQEAARARDDMMAVVSHDLRNPLNVVLMCAETMQRRFQGEPSAARMLERIGRAADQMQRLIADLLDVSRIEAGKFTVNRGEISLAAIAEELRESFAPLAEKEGIAFVLRLPNLAPLDADRDRVLQVFSNLIGNALKFTQTGGRVTVEGEPLGAFARFTVADTGEGIPPEVLPHVFTRHYQARDKAHLGAGLGLFIARTIVEAHGGTIEVASRRGEGTRFTFTLPLAVR